MKQFPCHDKQFNLEKSMLSVEENPMVGQIDAKTKSRAMEEIGNCFIATSNPDLAGPRVGLGIF